MITGFNTDIEHDGVVYHVQTEDKGLDTPIILSLVYSGGAILASKRAPYQDLIASGFSDEALSERLKRQHKLICAAIHSGRIDDLKKMSARQEVNTVASAPTAPLTPESSPDVVETPDASEASEVEEVTVSAEPEVETQVAAPEVEVAAPEPEKEAEVVEQEFEFDFHNTQEWKPTAPVEEPVEEAPAEAEPEPVVSAQPAGPLEPAPYTIYDPRRQHALEAEPNIGLVITLLDDEEFYAGESRTLRVLVTDYTGDNHKALAGVAVSVKILGTAFRPIIRSVKTERDGVAIVETQIPDFKSGRAAVLVKATSKDKSAELRRVIHPSR